MNVLLTSCGLETFVRKQDNRVRRSGGREISYYNENIIENQE